MHGNAAEEAGGVEPPRNYRRLARRCRRRRFLWDFVLNCRLECNLPTVPSFERNPSQDNRRQRGQEQEERETAQRPQTKSYHAFRYFFIQATITMMTPITLRTDINPAGMRWPVLMKAGMKRPASAIEITPARARPSANFPGRSKAAINKRIPAIEPAIMDAVLPAFTYPITPPTIVRRPKTMK